MALEGYVKVTVSELSRNLVPSEENSDPKKSKFDPPPRPSIRFFLTRCFEESEFRSQVQTVWIQGFVINSSKNEEVVEVADEPVASGVERSKFESVIVTGCEKVPRGPQGLHLTGHYCQFLAEISGIDVYGKVRLRAIKIVDLDGEDVLKQSWPIEVEDLKREAYKLSQH